MMVMTETKVERRPLEEADSQEAWSEQPFDQLEALQLA